MNSAQQDIRERPGFKVVCCECGSLSIKMADFANAPDDTKIECGRCTRRPGHAGGAACSGATRKRYLRILIRRERSLTQAWTIRSLTAIAGFAVWTLFSIPLLTGRAGIREAWDFPAYWHVGHSAVVAAGGGRGLFQQGRAVEARAVGRCRALPRSGPGEAADDRFRPVAAFAAAAWDCPVLAPSRWRSGWASRGASWFNQAFDYF